jgi:hypothetical protein
LVDYRPVSVFAMRSSASRTSSSGARVSISAVEVTLGGSDERAEPEQPGAPIHHDDLGQTVLTSFDEGPSAVV